MKNYVKTLNKEGNAFKYLAMRVPYISEAKLKAGIFVGPQIRELLSDQDFKSKMNSVEKHAWHVFEAFVSNFLGNNKSEESQDIVRNMIKTYEALGSRISVKIYFLNSHFDHFPANLGAFSEKQSKRFHQDISEMETRYQGRWNETMMADYCWCLKRHNPTASHNRKSRKKRSNMYNEIHVRFYFVFCVF